jgi:lysophospholipase L1-like esterase
MTARFLFFHRTLRAALVSALLVSALVSALAQTQTTLKKKHAAASAASPTASPAKHPASSGHATTSAHAAGRRHATATHARVHYYAPHLDPAHRAALVEEIGARLKEPAPHAIDGQDALDGFYAQLASREEEQHDGEPATGTLRVLQWGDSHTAADMFTAEARHVFQTQFGDGGIGYSYSGHPFAGYRIIGSARSQSTGWKTQGNKFLQLGDGNLGMGGISISTQRAGEWVTLDAPCTALELQYLEQPGGGSLRFTDNDGEPTEIQTAADQVGAGTFRYPCAPGDHHFEVKTEDAAPVTLLGWVATQPGVTWEAIGINGAEAPLILKWNQPIFSSYLKDNSPSLIVLAYGTNEAASADWDEQSYEQTFASLIDTIHQYVPESSILVIGPGDRSVMRHRVWHTFDGTDRIVQAQRAVCRTHDCAYWNWQDRMGGSGAMQQWASAGWAQPDHTHFTGDGYRALADAFMADLMAGFQSYKDRHSPETETSIEGAAHGPGSTNP